MQATTRAWLRDRDPKPGSRQRTQRTQRTQADQADQAGHYRAREQQLSRKPE